MSDKRQFHHPRDTRMQGPVFSRAQLSFLASLPPEDPFSSIEDFKEAMVQQGFAKDINHAAQIVRSIELTPEEA